MKPRPRVRVYVSMRHLAFVVLAACGGTSAPTQEPMSGSGSADPPGVVRDTRTEIERRRDAACEKLRSRLVQCAVDDARVELEAGRMSKQDFDANTAPAIRTKLGEKWIEACRVDMSSRQVRVLEVCDREEQDCGPLLSCLGHLNENVK